MAFISKSTIQEVNARLDAVSVVGEYIRLEKKSGRWFGRCPFHAGGQEKTPSFKVDPDLKMYHCFGCNKGGSVISFVMEMDKISYPEAIKSLASKMSIEIVYEEGADRSRENQDNSTKEELYELYKRCTVTFQHFLCERPDGKETLKYLEDRGISNEMIEEFKLGFSPSDRNFLYNFLKQKGYSENFLSVSGLFSSRYKTAALFSARLMFPITDRQGRIVAFGGRALPGAVQSDGSEPPKYINSPETEIYKKGQTLFAIDRAKAQMRQTKTVYLAEGYMDVIAMHQGGICNSVAPLGTAFTDEQAKWLNRWAERVILLFDNDEAGHKAAYKAIITCRKNGISCHIADITEGLKSEIGSDSSEIFKDPAEILQKKGQETLKKVFKFTINDFEYLISRSRLQYNTRGTSLQGAPQGGINKAAEFMFPYLNALDSEIELADSITRIADIFKIERNAVNKDYLNWKGSSREINERPAEVNQKLSGSAGLHIQRNEELSLLTNVALNMELYPEFRADVEIKEIDDRAAKELFIALEECYKYDESGIDSLMERINDENLRNYISNTGTTGEFKSGHGTLSRKFMEDGINRIKKKRLEKRLIEINAQMRESERTLDYETDLDELLEEKQIIDSQIRKLEGR